MKVPNHLPWSRRTYLLWSRGTVVVCGARAGPVSELVVAFESSAGVKPRLPLLNPHQILRLLPSARQLISSLCQDSGCSKVFEVVCLTAGSCSTNLHSSSSFSAAPPKPRFCFAPVGELTSVAHQL